MSESDKHWIIQIHVFGMNEYHRDQFFDRIVEEAFRYEDDEVFVGAGPCEEEDCHDEDAEDEY